jgi:hypothetical protein
MVQKLCTTGNNELLKCSVHGASGIIAGVMAAYNIAACCFRRDRHLRVNAFVYTLLVAYELKQTLHHLSYIQAARHAAPPGVAAGTVQEEKGETIARCA